MCRMLPNPHHPRVLTQGSRLMHGSRGNSHSPSRKNQPQARDAKEDHGSNKRWLTYNHTSKPTPQSIRERNITVTSYYNQTAIDEACQQNSIRLTPSTIMYTGPLKDGSHIMKSAKYLRRCFLALVLGMTMTKLVNLSSLFFFLAGSFQFVSLTGLRGSVICLLLSAVTPPFWPFTSSTFALSTFSTTFQKSSQLRTRRGTVIYCANFWMITKMSSKTWLQGSKSPANTSR